MGTVAHTYNLGPWEAETGGSSVGGQFDLTESWRPPWTTKQSPASIFKNSLLLCVLNFYVASPFCALI